MAHSSKHFKDESGKPSVNQTPTRGMDQGQLDFELEFFQAILNQHPNYVEVLRALGQLLTLKGRYPEVLQIDKRLVQLRPGDSLAHYNLACSYALLKRPDQSIKTLQRAIELGYRDFRYMREDRDLESIRHDPRFRKLMQEHENR
jgi:tetratricopeptide (TPR) repeat protein